MNKKITKSCSQDITIHYVSDCQSQFTSDLGSLQLQNAAALYSCLGIFLRLKRRASHFHTNAHTIFMSLSLLVSRQNIRLEIHHHRKKTKEVVYYTVHNAHDSSSRQTDVYLAADKIEHINSLCSGVDKRGTAFYKMNKSNGKSCLVDGYIICFLSMFLHD